MAVRGTRIFLTLSRRKAIIWTNASILLIVPLGTYSSEIQIKLQQFPFRNIDMKMLSIKWRSVCLGVNVLKLELWAERSFIILPGIPKDDIRSTWRTIPEHTWYLAKNITLFPSRILSTGVVTLSSSMTSVSSMMSRLIACIFGGLTTEGAFLSPKNYTNCPHNWECQIKIPFAFSLCAGQLCADFK